MACKRPYKHFLELLKRFFGRSSDSVQSPASTSPSQYDERKSEQEDGTASIIGIMGEFFGDSTGDAQNYPSLALLQSELAVKGVILSENEAEDVYYGLSDAYYFRNGLVKRKLRRSGRCGEVLYDGFGGVRSVYEKDGKRYESYFARIFRRDHTLPLKFDYVAYDTYSGKLYLQDEDGLYRPRVFVYELDECTRRGLIAAMTLNNAPPALQEHYREQLQRNLLNGDEAETACARNVLAGEYDFPRKRRVGDPVVSVTAFLHEVIRSKERLATYTGAQKMEAILDFALRPGASLPYSGIEVAGRREPAFDGDLTPLLEEIAVMPRGMESTYMDRVWEAIQCIQSIEDDEARKQWQKHLDESLAIVLDKMQRLLLQEEALSETDARQIDNAIQTLRRMAREGLLDEEIARDGIKTLWDSYVTGRIQKRTSAMDAMRAVGAMLALLPLADEEEFIRQIADEIIDGGFAAIKNNDNEHYDRHEALEEYTDVVGQRGTDLSPEVTGRIVRKSIDVISEALAEAKSEDWDQRSPSTIRIIEGRILLTNLLQSKGQATLSPANADFVFEATKAWLENDEVITTLAKTSAPSALHEIAEYLSMSRSLPETKRVELANLLLTTTKRILADKSFVDMRRFNPSFAQTLQSVASIAGDLSGVLPDEVSEQAIEILEGVLTYKRPYLAGIDSVKANVYMGHALQHLSYASSNLRDALARVYGQGTAIAADDPVAQRVAARMQRFVEMALKYRPANVIPRTLSEAKRADSAERIRTDIFRDAFMANIPLKPRVRNGALKVMLKQWTPLALARVFIYNTRLDEEDARAIANTFVASVEERYRTGEDSGWMQSELDYLRSLEALTHLPDLAAINAPQRHQVKREIVRQTLPHLLRGLELVATQIKKDVPSLSYQMNMKLVARLESLVQESRETGLLDEDEVQRIQESVDKYNAKNYIGQREWSSYAFSKPAYIA